MKSVLLNINWSHVICWIGGALWTWIEPTVPFALLCIFAVFVDCMSAWRLNRRIRRKYGNKAADGKLKSQHMSKMISDLFVLFGVMLIAQGINQFVITSFDIPLGNAVAAIFLLYTIVSVLENESSTNDNTWARVVQRYVVDKTRRHLMVDLSELTTDDVLRERAEVKEVNDTGYEQDI